MLLTIDNLLSQDDVNQLRHQLHNAEWQDGQITAGSLARQVKANQQLNEQSPIARPLQQMLLQRLGNNGLFISAALPNKIYPPKFNCYQNGGHYGLHIDNALMTMPDNQWLRTDISATLFLTDPDHYEGGELCIETQFGVQQVKLNAGDLVLYPSTSLHQVLPVTQGQRICAFFWVESLVKNPQYREYLFELDQSIQVLTAERGASDNEVTRLSGLYHNLMRSWAQP